MWGFTHKRTIALENRAGKSIDLGLVRMTVRGQAERLAVELHGELDFTSIDAVVIALSQLNGRVATIDLAGLEFLDGDSALALLDIAGMRVPGGEAPRLIHVGRQTRRTLDLVRQHRTPSDAAVVGEPALGFVGALDTEPALV
jgi:anti-anti-sigma regulatory factor